MSIRSISLRFLGQFAESPAWFVSWIVFCSFISDAVKTQHRLLYVRRRVVDGLLTVNPWNMTRCRQGVADSGTEFAPSPTTSLHWVMLSFRCSTFLTVVAVVKSFLIDMCSCVLTVAVPPPGRAGCAQVPPDKGIQGQVARTNQEQQQQQHRRRAAARRRACNLQGDGRS